MGNIGDLLKLKKEGAENSLSFTRFNGVTYYAICTTHEHDKKLINLLNDVFGDDSIICKKEKTFILVNEVFNMDLNAMVFEKNFYDGLESNYKNDADYSKFNLSKINYTDIDKDIYDNRTYSCAERKIIGTLNPKKITDITLYSTKQPCFFCIPSTGKTWFWKENSARFIMLKKQKGNIFYFKYK